MIGPHERKELELMLAGNKSLAMFHDVLPTHGEISEEIIPEQAFAPHVTAGTFKRFARDISNVDNNDVIRFVCFTLPGEEWRAEFLLWFKHELFSNHISHNSAHDEIIGKLLGYCGADIAEFISKTS